MTLLDEINEKCSPELIASREHGAIAAAVSAGRVRISQRMGGIGTVLETLGPDAGAALLDDLEAQAASIPALKWAWVLINRGELDFGSPATRSMIEVLVPSPAKEALMAVAESADPVSAYRVATAMTGGE